MVHKIQPLVRLAGMHGTLCHGCFDILHVGHIRQLAQARALHAGPVIVTLTADAFIRKGPGRPVFPDVIRAECVAALETVDYVAIVEEATGLSAIDTIRPRYYVKGEEYEGMGGIAELERIAVESHGGMMVYTKRWCSSTSLVERLTA